MSKPRKRCKRPTKEQRKAIWSEPETNAGAGWIPKHPEQAKVRCNPKKDVRE